MRHATGVDVPVQRASASACRAGSVRGKGVFVAVLIGQGGSVFLFLYVWGLGLSCVGHSGVLAGLSCCNTTCVLAHMHRCCNCILACQCISISGSYIVLQSSNGTTPKSPNFKWFTKLANASDRLRCSRNVKVLSF